LILSSDDFRRGPVNVAVITLNYIAKSLKTHITRFFAFLLQDIDWLHD